MNRPQSTHLNADELDSYHTQTCSSDALSHVATCVSCAALVANDRRVIEALGRLPMFDPAPGFADRVVAQWAVRRSSMVETPRAVAARRRAVGFALAGMGGLAAAFCWAAAYPAAAVRWAGPAVEHAGQSLWQSWQALAASATAQPWFPAARDTFDSPARAVGTLAAVALAYTIALSVLKRLMTEPATHATW